MVLIKVNFKSLFLILATLNILGADIYCQNTIAIDSSLMLQSKQMKLKRKGAGSIGRYQFGDFKIVNGKKGIVKEKMNSEFFGNETEINTESSFWFEMTIKSNDTIRVDAFYFENIVFDKGNWFSRTFLNWNDLEEKSHLSRLTAEISFSKDQPTWYFTILNPVKYNLEDILFREAEGEITNNEQHILIKKIIENRSGKKATIFRPILGYEFWLGNKAIGAVQLLPHKYSLVWIRSNLDNETQKALATGIGLLSVMFI